MSETTEPLTGNTAKLVFALLVVSIFSAAFHLEAPANLWQLPLTIEVLDSPDTSIDDPVEIPDFAAIQDVETKKQVFFDFLQPYIDAENEKVRQQRERLAGLIEKITQGKTLDRIERVFIRELSTEYELEFDNELDIAFLNRLLRRVDVIPPSLVLAQAANESAWGTSRFAQQANNFFGQWCYSEGCGLVPKRRRASASHEVKAFNSIEDAVNAYFMNLNTFPSYLDLRLIRAGLRENSQPIDGISLTEGLASYSERGEDYIEELRSMIHYNQLLERDYTIIPE